MTKWDADRLHQYTRKGGDAARAAKTRGPVTRPSTLPITALNSREDAYKLLRENQTEWFRLQTVDGVDDSRHDIHPLRFAPGPHLAPSDAFTLGLINWKETRPPAYWHDISHLQAGNMVDHRAYARSNNLTDGALRLEVFRPNSLTKPDNDHPLCNMREVQKALFLMMALVRRQRPWDSSPELIWDYLIENEWFEPLSRPFSGFYRKPAHPPHSAVHTLVLATHRALVQSLAISTGPLSRATIDEIHRQRCSEEPANWSLSPAGVTLARKEKLIREKPKKPAATTSANDLRSRVKRAIKDSGENICINYNLAISCSRPQSAAGCSFRKQGQIVELYHTCAFLSPNGTRCGATHSWKSNHP